jgi:hypothetical protein
MQVFTLFHIILVLCHIKICHARPPQADYRASISAKKVGFPTKTFGNDNEER